MSIEDIKTIEEYYGVIIPEEVMDAFIGIAESVWVYNRPVFDESLIPDGYIFPEMKYKPIIVSRMTLDEIRCVDKESNWLYDDPEFDVACIGITEEGQFIYNYMDVAEAYTLTETKFVDEEGKDVYDGTGKEVPWDIEDAEEWIDFNDLREYSNCKLGKPIIYEDLTEYYD